MQIVGQGGRGVVPAVGVLFQAFQADCFQITGDLGDQARRRHRIVVGDLVHRCQGGLASERRPSGEQLVEDGS